MPGRKARAVQVEGTHIDAIPHPEDREMGLKMFDRAYADIDVVQTFMKSR